MEWRVGRKEKVTKYAITKSVLLAYEKINIANLTAGSKEMLSFYTCEKAKRIYSVKKYTKSYKGDFLCLVPKHIPTNQIKKTCAYQILFHLSAPCHTFSNFLIISCHKQTQVGTTSDCKLLEAYLLS